MLGALGLGVAYVYSSKGGRQTITVNGHSWYMEKVGETVTETSYLVIAPEKSFGPHLEMPVMQFSQMKVAPNTRRLMSKYPDVPSGIFDAAATDFGVPITF